MPIIISQTQNETLASGTFVGTSINTDIISLTVAGTVTLPSSTDTVPVMTGYTNGSVTISANSDVQAPAWQAFGVEATANSTWIPANDSFPNWIKVDYGASNSKTIIKYTVSSRDNALLANQPRDWQLQGSNTGAFTGEQTVLDTQINQSNWGSAEKRTFYFTNTVAYRYYRLYVTANNTPTGITSYVSISNIEYMEGVSSNTYPVTGYVEFPSHDLTQYFQSVTSINNTINVPSGTTLQIYTATSIDNVSFDAYVLLNGDNTIASTQRRYIKIKCVFTSGGTSSTRAIDDFNSADSVNFTTDSQLTFDGSLYLKTSYVNSMTKDVSFTDTGTLFRASIDRSQITLLNVSVI